MDRSVARTRGDVDRSVPCLTLNSRADMVAANQRLSVRLAEPDVPSSGFGTSDCASFDSSIPRLAMMPAQSEDIAHPVEPVLGFKVEDAGIDGADGPVCVWPEAEVGLDFGI